MAYKIIILSILIAATIAGDPPALQIPIGENQPTIQIFVSSLPPQSSSSPVIRYTSTPTHSTPLIQQEPVLHYAARLSPVQIPDAQSSLQYSESLPKFTALAQLVPLRLHLSEVGSQYSAPAQYAPPAQYPTPAQYTAPTQYAAPAQDTAPAQYAAPVQYIAPAQHAASPQYATPVQFAANPRPTIKFRPEAVQYASAPLHISSAQVQYAATPAKEVNPYERNEAVPFQIVVNDAQRVVESAQSYIPVAKVAKVIKKDDFDHNPEYSYGYDIEDTETGDTKSQSEQRQGNYVQGSYSVVDPDGHRRTVKYTADPVHGFSAVVQRVPVQTKVKRTK